MTPHAAPALRLRGRRAGLVRLLVLPPAGIAALALAPEAAVRGSLTPSTLAFSAMMLAIAGLGWLHETVRQTLVADDYGVRWSRGLRRRVFSWAEIQDMGAAGPVLGLQGIGLRLVSASDPGDSPSTEYDFIVPNDFDAPTATIVAELRDRWRRATIRTSAPSRQDERPPRPRSTSRSSATSPMS